MTFTAENYHDLCDELAAKHAVFAKILADYGYPLHQTRTADFTTLLRLILEQQVSLSSAKACFDKLKNLSDITPEAILALSDDELRSVGISRQKTVYLRALATAIQTKTLDLAQLDARTNAEVRAELTAIKGIGNWTADVFLMECLCRTDLFPIGDVALRNAMKKALDLPADTSHDDLSALAEAYRPLRSIATFIFWHEYVSSKGIDLKKMLES